MIGEYRMIISGGICILIKIYLLSKLYIFKFQDQI